MVVDQSNSLKDQVEPADENLRHSEKLGYARTTLRDTA